MKTIGLVIDVVKILQIDQRTSSFAEQTLLRLRVSLRRSSVRLALVTKCHSSLSAFAAKESVLKR